MWDELHADAATPIFALTCCNCNIYDGGRIYLVAYRSGGNNELSV